MEHETKQRVVGSFVLVMLALIFLPLILDGDGGYQPGIESRVPQTPNVDIMPEPIPLRPVIEADRFPTPQESAPPVLLTDLPVEAEPEPVTEAEATDLAQSADPQQSDPVPLVDSKPTLDPVALPESWSVRLGVFSNQQNAVNLEARLLNAGYRAYTRAMPAAQGTATGVFVGPQVDRDEANRLKSRLQEEFELSGLVVRFEVESF